jgi:voltage-gated potassium channel
MTESPASRLAAWETRTATPLVVAAVLFIGVLAYPVIEPDPSRGGELAVRALNIAIWLVFAADYAVRLRLSPDRRRFVRTHLADLAVVAVPALRPLRLLRLLSVARLVTKRTKKLLLGSVLKLVGGAATLLVFVSAVGVLNYERPERDSNITDFGEALWWACTTITTVGYGDHYPITPAGKVIAVLLMLVGVALLGILTAGIAAWFVQTVSREDEIQQNQQAETTELAEIRDRLAAIEALLRRQAP